MRRALDAGTDRVRLFVLAAAAVALVVRPARAHYLVAAALVLAAGAVERARRAARGTALGPAVAWGAVTTGLGIVAQYLASAEGLETGRPLSGQLTYLMTLAALATLVSVLNARTPGAGAWAILTALLVVVFLIPWLEGAGLRGAGRGLARLRLDNPWAIFFGLLVVAGVTNYLPTRYGPAAALLAVGFGLEAYGLTHPERPPRARALLWPCFPLAWAAALAAADRMARRGVPPSSAFDAVWLGFRDHWGVVWALRVQERFNRSARALGWPLRLTWQGAEVPEGAPPWDEPAAAATLTGLLRRFATPARFEAAARRADQAPCQRPGVR